MDISVADRQALLDSYSATISSADSTTDAKVAAIVSVLKLYGLI